MVFAIVKVRDAAVSVKLTQRIPSGEAGTYLLESTGGKTREAATDRPELVGGIARVAASYSPEFVCGIACESRTDRYESVGVKEHEATLAVTRTLLDPAGKSATDQP